MTFESAGLNISGRLNECPKLLSMSRSNSTRRRFQLRSLIIAAAILHLCTSLAVFMVGKYQLFPSQIYPTGIGRFASDGLIYQPQLVELCNILKSEGPRAWATWPTQLHVRLYSLPLAPISRWVSFNILTIEPLNLFFYLAIIVLVFKLGEAIFGHKAGLIAATIVALWPSLLLHTTQLVRDPLLILAVLLLLWCLVELIHGEFSWRRGVGLALASIVALVTIRIVRLPMWSVIVAVVVMGLSFFVVRSIRKRLFHSAAVAYALLLIVGVLVIPRLQPYFHNQQELGITRTIENEWWQKRPVEEQIYARREAFNLDSNGEPVVAGDSRIDAEVRLNSRAAIVRHLPRAMIVGFFAPFPNMWLGPGKQVGASGRLISGFEMLFTYVIESMALFGLWSRRRSLAAWLLGIVIGMGAVSLGLVIINMGAMYRLRYPFWILMVVLGAGGALFLWQRFRADESAEKVQVEKSPFD